MRPSRMFAGVGYAALFNVFDSRDNDTTYLYESQLPGEAQPVTTSISTRSSRAPAAL